MCGWECFSKRIIGVCNFGGCPSVGSRRLCWFLRRRKIVPALDENGDAAGWSSHAADGVNTELLINKMPPQRWYWAGQAVKTTTITTTIGCERRGCGDGGGTQRQWSGWGGGSLAAGFDGESSTHFHRHRPTHRSCCKLHGWSGSGQKEGGCACLRKAFPFDIGRCRLFCLLTATNWQLTRAAQRQKTGSLCCPKSWKTAFPARYKS